MSESVYDQQEAPEDIDKLIVAHLETNRKIKELERLKDEIKVKIDIFLKTKQVDSYQDNSGNWVYFKTQNRTTLDTKAIRDYFAEKKENIKPFERTTEVKILKVEKHTEAEE